MYIHFHQTKSNFFTKLMSTWMVVALVLTCIIPPSHAQTVTTALPFLSNLPAPGTMVAQTAQFAPPLIKGITIHPENPLQFDFIIDNGDKALSGQKLKDEATQLIKYFLASLTVPEDEMWVNLSPYEKDRIAPEGFGQTEMGRDLLAQDYLLKQLTASLIYPEDELGEKFWDRVYEKVQDQYDINEIPVNTFTRVWVVPQKATVLEHENSAFVVESHLKVMLEEDYNALQANMGNAKFGLNATNIDPHPVNAATSDIAREILIPEIEREVNEGETFANLRQIYNSMILATWYKINLEKGLLGQIYVDKNKIEGVHAEDRNVKQKIYNQYLEAFKEGVYSYIKEGYDPTLNDIVARKYFSGGFSTQGVDLPGVTGFASSPAGTMRALIERTVVPYRRLVGIDPDDRNQIARALRRLKNAFRVSVILERTENPNGPQLALLQAASSPIVQEGSLLDAVKIPTGIKIADRGVKLVPLAKTMLSDKRNELVKLQRLGGGNVRFNVDVLLSSTSEYHQDMSFAAVDRDGHILGLAILADSPDRNGYAYLNHIAIDPAYQGTGLTSLLLYHTFENLRTLGRGYTDVHLTTTTEFDSQQKGWQGAIDYLKEIGFRLDITPERYLGVILNEDAGGRTVSIDYAYKSTLDRALHKLIFELQDQFELLSDPEILDLARQAFIQYFEHPYWVSAQTVEQIVAALQKSEDRDTFLRHEEVVQGWRKEVYSFEDGQGVENPLRYFAIRFANLLGRDDNLGKVYWTRAGNLKTVEFGPVLKKFNKLGPTAKDEQQVRDLVEKWIGAQAATGPLVGDVSGTGSDSDAGTNRLVFVDGASGGQWHIENYTSDAFFPLAANANDRLQAALAASPASSETSSPTPVSTAEQDVARPEAPGGIDLDPTLLDLQIKRDGRGIPLPLPMQDVDQINISGFLPIIINITPVSNVPMYFGFADTEDSDQENESDLTFDVFDRKEQLFTRDIDEISYLN